MPRSQSSNPRKHVHGPNPRIGGPLYALLEERFISHTELAQALDVHPQNVSRWVRNETGPTKRRLRQIAEYFGVEPASLVETEAEDDDPSPIAA